MNLTQHPHTAYLGLGSNQGDRRRFLEKAIHALDRQTGLRVCRVAGLYESEPIGPRQRAYYNSAVEIKSRLSPRDLMKTILSVEKSLGRVRSVKWGPRTIDVDILLYGKRRINSSHLKVPHPFMDQRRFVLIPLCDLVPRSVHPTLKQQNQTLLRQLTPLGQRVTMVGLWRKSRFYPSRRRKNPASPS